MSKGGTNANEGFGACDSCAAAFVTRDSILYLHGSVKVLQVTRMPVYVKDLSGQASRPRTHADGPAGPISALAYL